jgi:streptogrisin C
VFARNLPRMLGAAAFVLLLSAALAAPSGAASSATGSPASDDQVSAGQLQALLRETGLSAAQAQQRLAEEAVASGVVSTLRAALGTSFAGAWFEPGGTDLIVATTDPAEAKLVRAAGVVPRTVTRDLPTLDRVMAALDSRADLVPDEVTGWYVDPSTNSVVVSATDPAAAEEFAAGQQEVRIEQVHTRPVLLADLPGGGGIEGSDGARCSIGFNVTSAAARYILTAGHCTVLGGIWSGENGIPIGPVAKTSFPNDDFGIIEVTSSSWQSTSGITTSSGRLTVTGSEPAPVGASVCRSGSTTGYRCGTIEAVDQTVNYGGGAVVYGLTRTSACAEPGDSGGSFISGSQAQGMLSGGTGNCFLSLLGSETFFQPVNEALSAYGLVLLTN